MTDSDTLTFEFDGEIYPITDEVVLTTVTLTVQSHTDFDKVKVVDENRLILYDTASNPMKATLASVDEYLERGNLSTPDGTPAIEAIVNSLDLTPLSR